MYLFVKAFYKTTKKLYQDNEGLLLRKLGALTKIMQELIDYVNVQAYDLQVKSRKLKNLGLIPCKIIYVCSTK